MREKGQELRRPERRGQSRSPVTGVKIRHVSLDGSLVDMSPRGLCIESSRGLRVGDRYTLLLTAPTTDMTVVASVRWCRLGAVRKGRHGSDFEPVFRAGLEFELGRYLDRHLDRHLDSNLAPLLSAASGTSSSNPSDPFRARPATTPSDVSPGG